MSSLSLTNFAYRSRKSIPHWVCLSRLSNWSWRWKRRKTREKIIQINESTNQQKQFFTYQNTFQRILKINEYKVKWRCLDYWMENSSSFPTRGVKFGVTQQSVCINISQFLFTQIKDTCPPASDSAVRVLFVCYVYIHTSKPNMWQRLQSRLNYNRCRFNLCIAIITWSQNYDQYEDQVLPRWKI